MFELAGKVALVTGASRGIGRAIAARLAAQGATVIAAARADHADACAGELRAAGHQADALTLDVTDAAAVEAVPGDVARRYGRLDILVSNAGITRDQLLMRMKRQDWDAVLDTNLTAAFTLTQAAMRPMIRQQSGRIIAISSVVGQVGNAGQVNYAASKAGLIGFAKALAREVASRRITVNVIAPGLIDTDMTRAINRPAHGDWASQIPLGRLGTVDDVAAAAWVLASREGRDISGHRVAVHSGGEQWM